MKKICIVGSGRWARRLQKRFEENEIAAADLLNSRADIINVSGYPEVLVCVPASCLAEVLSRVEWGEEKKIVVSCAKGLLGSGQTPCEYIEENFKDKMDGRPGFLGGPNIDDGYEIIEIEKPDDEFNKLEIACILKNVYAIGFGMALNKGENFASHQLSKYLAELKEMGVTEKYWADLLVSCYSDKSRNKTYGRKLYTAEIYDEKTVEGLNSARIIEKYNLFPELKELRKITGEIGA